jgi:hypothetical protein
LLLLPLLLLHLLLLLRLLLLPLLLPASVRKVAPFSTAKGQVLTE